MKVNIEIRNEIGVLISTFTVERDVEEYIKTMREIYSEEWAEFLERLHIEGLLS